MSRAIIGGLIAAIILVFTAVAYVVTTSELEQRTHKEVKLRVERAQQQLIQNASLQGLSLLKRVEALATDAMFVSALRAEPKERKQIARLAFESFVQKRDEGDAKPDIMALTDATGDLVGLRGVENPLPKAWKVGEDFKYPAIGLALKERQITSEVWDFEKDGLMKVGVAPVIDTESNAVLGALVVAYAMTARDAQRQQQLLGADVAYFHGAEIYATSFTRNAGEEDTAMRGRLVSILGSEGLGQSALEQGVAGKIITVSMNGQEYLATAGRLPRFSSRPLPEGYPASMIGAMVMMSLTSELAPLGTIKMYILLLGAVSFIVALLASMITAKRILHQADEIEDGINEIINGNLDRTIRPVGADLDGLASALNVMLARLLGRPEPGEEEFDEDGNVVHAGTVNFDNEELAHLSPADSASLALAQESEPEYYSRLFKEYVKAREQVGESTSGVTYENFVAKLRLNESNLKHKYQCSAVRFRVDVKDGKVSLKPVPIV